MLFVFLVITVMFDPWTESEFQEQQKREVTGVPDAGSSHPPVTLSASPHRLSGVFEEARRRWSENKRTWEEQMGGRAGA